NKWPPSQSRKSEPYGPSRPKPEDAAWDTEMRSRSRWQRQKETAAAPNRIRPPPRPHVPSSAASSSRGAWVSLIVLDLLRHLFGRPGPARRLRLSIRWPPPGHKVEADHDAWPLESL